MTFWPFPQIDLENAGANRVDEEVVGDNGLVKVRKPDDLPTFCAKMIEELLRAAGRLTRTDAPIGSVERQLRRPTLRSAGPSRSAFWNGSACHLLAVANLRGDTTMNDADRIDALLDLIDPDRPPADSRGPQLAVLGLAAPLPKGGFRPTTAGWSLLGEKGRQFRSNTE